MINDEAGSMAVAHILEHTAVRAFKMNTDEINSAFDKAEAECLALDISDDMKLEARRRTAEWKMKLFCDRGVSFETVKELHNSVVALGYTNLETEGRMEIYFALYCERKNHVDYVRQSLHELCTKLDSAIKSRDSAIYRSLRDSAMKILSKVGIPRTHI